MKNRGQTIYSASERIERLSMPEPNSGCWIWTSSSRPNPCGIHYGRLMFGSRSDGSRKTYAAHRLSYEAFKGPIPDGVCVCHRCDNGLCVNPDHLFLGTQRENMIDAFRKGRLTLPWMRSEQRSPPRALQQKGSSNG